jgi:prepilin-type N-terminal cleavage/methylation domain-containing protein
MNTPRNSRATHVGRHAVPAGFTLLELLVAMAVTAILVVMLAGVVQNVLGLYSRMTGDPAMFSESKLAVRQLARDLESLGLPGATGGEILRMTPEQAGTVGQLDGKSAVWLTVLTSATDRDDSVLTSATDRDDSTPNPVEGALRAVSYRLARQNPIDGSSTEPTTALYRSIASAAHTFSNAPGKTNLQSGYWAILPSAPAPTPQPPTAIDNYLAGGVAGFQIRYHYVDTRGTASPTDDISAWTEPGDSVRISAEGSDRNGSSIPGGFRSAEITLTVLSRQGQLLLENGTLSLDEAVKKYGRTEVLQATLPQP